MPRSLIFALTGALITACAIIAKFGLETALQRFVGHARGRDPASGRRTPGRRSRKILLAR